MKPQRAAGTHQDNHIDLPAKVITDMDEQGRDAMPRQASAGGFLSQVLFSVQGQLQQALEQLILRNTHTKFFSTSSFANIRW